MNRDLTDFILGSAMLISTLFMNEMYAYIAGAIRESVASKMPTTEWYIYHMDRNQ